SISKLMELKPVNYDLIPEKLSSDSEAGTRFTDNDIINQMGFLAQDVQKIFPQLVKPLDEESDVLTLGYSGLIPVMIKGMQEQQEIIDRLIQENDELKSANSNLLNQINAIHNKLLQMEKEIAAFDR
ncbi:MAG: tail fiber domain-containing protein, partial [Bacteroidetes bacterium]